MSLQILPPITAGIAPEQFSDDLFFARNRTVAVIILTVLIVIGFVLRIHDLGAESLGEDELNKLQTVEEYRTNGITAKNGEHPFLMKGLQTVSIVTAEKLNNIIVSSGSQISEEAAIRFPVALFGTFTALLIFMLASELFGRSIGLVSAALWAVEPMAIGFDRIGKEDSLALFFFLLTMLFWVRGQTAAERGQPNWTLYIWAAAAGFAGLMASKYYPHMLAVIAAYYIIFQNIPETKWRFERIRWAKFFVVAGVVFLILNPTILIPDTWREMFKFSTENRIGHDSYEFMGELYRNKISLWLAGLPWTFYYVFIAVKTSLPTLALFLIGLPMMFRRKLGDGRFLIYFWAFFWFMPFTFLGGKFTRYFAMVEPIILIVAAVGFCVSVKWLFTRIALNSRLGDLCQAVLLIAVVAIPLWNSLSVGPHFRLFTNTLGGGMSAAGSYFPHDEFYDASTRDIVAEIKANARTGAAVACETPVLFEYYAQKIGRDDLTFISLSEKETVAQLSDGDLIVLAKGRRYWSNQAYIDYLETSAVPVAKTKTLDIVSARLYKLDEISLSHIKDLAK